MDKGVCCFMFKASLYRKRHVSVRRTYLLLMKALLDLLAEMPFEKISLTDICRVSMVSRSTFYRYFEDKYDLLHYCIKMYIEDFARWRTFYISGT